MSFHCRIQWSLFCRIRLLVTRFWRRFSTSILCFLCHSFLLLFSSGAVQFQVIALTLAVFNHLFCSWVLPVNSSLSKRRNFQDTDGGVCTDDVAVHWVTPRSGLFHRLLHLLLLTILYAVTQHDTRLPRRPLGWSSFDAHPKPRVVSFLHDLWRSNSLWVPYLDRQLTVALSRLKSFEPTGEQVSMRSHWHIWTSPRCPLYLYSERKTHSVNRRSTCLPFPSIYSHEAESVSPSSSAQSTVTRYPMPEVPSSTPGRFDR